MSLRTVSSGCQRSGGRSPPPLPLGPPPQFPVAEVIIRWTTCVRGPLTLFAPPFKLPPARSPFVRGVFTPPGLTGVARDGPVGLTDGDRKTPVAAPVLRCMAAAAGTARRGSCLGGVQALGAVTCARARCKTAARGATGAARKAAFGDAGVAAGTGRAGSLPGQGACCFVI